MKWKSFACPRGLCVSVCVYVLICPFHAIISLPEKRRWHLSCCVAIPTRRWDNSARTGWLMNFKVIPSFGILRAFAVGIIIFWRGPRVCRSFDVIFLAPNDLMIQLKLSKTNDFEYSGKDPKWRVNYGFHSSENLSVFPCQRKVLQNSSIETQNLSPNRANESQRE